MSANQLVDDCRAFMAKNGVRFFGRRDPEFFENVARVLAGLLGESFPNRHVRVLWSPDAFSVQQYLANAVRCEGDVQTPEEFAEDIDAIEDDVTEAVRPVLERLAGSFDSDPHFGNLLRLAPVFVDAMRDAGLIWPAVAGISGVMLLDFEPRMGHAATFVMDAEALRRLACDEIVAFPDEWGCRLSGAAKFAVRIADEAPRDAVRMEFRPFMRFEDEEEE